MGTISNLSAMNFATVKPLAPVTMPAAASPGYMPAPIGADNSVPDATYPDMDLKEPDTDSIASEESNETQQVIKRGKVQLTPFKPMQKQQKFADADLKEPSGKAHWTLREEDDFLLAVNQRTGKMGKVKLEDLSPAEKKAVDAKHGAGPIDSEGPDRQRTVAGDMEMSGSYADMNMPNTGGSGVQQFNQPQAMQQFAPQQQLQQNQRPMAANVPAQANQMQQFNQPQAMQQFNQPAQQMQQFVPPPQSQVANPYASAIQNPQAQQQLQVQNGLGGAQKSAAGGMQAFSDMDLKTNVASGDKPVDQFLNQLEAHSYQYKDAKHGKGTHFSVMAQELEKAGDVGKSMVIDTPEGKKVDYARGFAVYLAAATMLNDRQNEMEKTIKALKKAIKK